MAAKRTLGWITGLTLVSMMAGCASQAPSITSTPKVQGPALIQGDTLILPSQDQTLQAGQKLDIRWSMKDFRDLPSKIEAGSADAAGLIPAGAMGGGAPPAGNGGGNGYGGPGMGMPPVGPGYGAGPGCGIAPFAPFGGLSPGFCPAPYGFAFGTPAIFPKTLFIHPDVYYLRRHALYFPYSRLGGYFYPISVPYGARFYTPVLAYGFGSLYPYTFSSVTCPLPTPFPGQLPCGPGVGAPAVGAGAYVPGAAYSRPYARAFARHHVRQDVRERVGQYGRMGGGQQQSY